jgi:hypothetical protein
VLELEPKWIRDGVAAALVVVLVVVVVVIVVVPHCVSQQSQPELVPTMTSEA